MASTIYAVWPCTAKDFTQRELGRVLVMSWAERNLLATQGNTERRVTINGYLTEPEADRDDEHV